MMKNILIPTDFTPESLEQIGLLAEQDPKVRFEVTLVHFIKMSDSMSELLLLSQRTREYAYITDDFIAQCAEWRKKFGSQVYDVRVEFFYGSTAAVFRNYLEGNNIDAIAYNPEYALKKACKNSIDPVTLIARSGLQVISLDQQSAVKTEKVFSVRELEERVVTQATL